MLPTGQRNRLNSKGLTFIEIVLVVIIISVLAGLSSPLFRRSFSGIQLKETLQELTQLMRYAQATAIAERKVYRINFDFGQGKFWVTCQGVEKPLEFEMIKGKWGKVVTVGSAITIKPRDEIPSEEENSYISFYPDGTPDKATIQISDNKGESFAITAQRKIGYVQVEE